MRPLTRTRSALILGLALTIPATALAQNAKGKEVYEKTCIACHTAGIAGAPKFGDAKDWAPRIKAGMDTL